MQTKEQIVILLAECVYSLFLSYRRRVLPVQYPAQLQRSVGKLIAFLRDLRQKFSVAQLGPDIFGIGIRFLKSSQARSVNASAVIRTNRGFVVGTDFVNFPFALHG